MDAVMRGDATAAQMAVSSSPSGAMRTRACLECLAEVRSRVGVPLMPMTYASILEAYGYIRFAADAPRRP